MHRLGIIPITLLTFILPSFGGSCLQFKKTQSFPIGATPTSSIRGDFNRDGKLDVASLTPTSIVVQLGNGDGTFRTPLVSPAPPSPVAFDQGDFDGDGNTDLVVVTGDYDTVFPTVNILLNQGNGQFASGAVFPLPPGTTSSGRLVPTAVTAGDVNGDGRVDIVANSSIYIDYGADSELVVFLNGGKLQFTPSGPSRMVPFVRDLRLADFTGDGKPDIVATSWQMSLSGAFVAGGVQILRNQGSGAFQALPFFKTNELSTALGVADYNMDGKMDVAYTVSYSTNVGLLLGDGKGGLLMSGHYGNFTSSGRLVPRDYNLDGVPDLLAGADAGAVTLLPNYGDGTFGADGSIYFGQSVRSIMPGDFTGDGVLDLVVNDPQGANLIMMQGINVCQTQPQTVITQLPFTGTYPADNAQVMTSAAGDLNGDGLDDLVLAFHDRSVTPGPIWAFLSQGDGSFKPAPQRYTVLDYSFTIDPIRNIAIADMDGDKVADLVVSIDQGVLVYRGNGDGTFVPPPGVLGMGANYTLPVDVNSDGRLDLVVATPLQSVQTFLNTGGGNFALASSAQMLNTPVWEAAGDFDQDGKVDLAVATSIGVYTFRGDGTGTFARSGIIGGAATTVAVGDANHDRKLDVITQDSVIPGKGNGNFGTPTTYADQPGIAAVTGYLDPGNFLDIAQANPAGTVTLFLGQNRNGFDPYVLGVQSLYNNSLQLGHFTSDRAPGLALLSYSQQLPAGAFDYVYVNYVQLIKDWDPKLLSRIRQQIAGRK